MCLAVPLKLEKVEGEHGIVEMNGVRRKINLSLVECARPGDYVIVHAGFAISLLDEGEAMKTIEMIREVMDY